MMDTVYDALLTLVTVVVVAGAIYLLTWRWTLVPITHAWRSERFGWVLGILFAWVACGSGWLAGLIYRGLHFEPGSSSDR